MLVGVFEPSQSQWIISGLETKVYLLLIPHTQNVHNSSLDANIKQNLQTSNATFQRSSRSGITLVEKKRKKKKEKKRRKKKSIGQDMLVSWKVCRSVRKVFFLVFFVVLLFVVCRFGLVFAVFLSCKHQSSVSDFRVAGVCCRARRACGCEEGRTAFRGS